VTKAKRTAWQQGWTYSCCFSALEAEIAISMSSHFGRFNPHGWPETPMFSKLSATHVVGVAQSTTQALANMDSYSPKHVERWSQPSQVWMEDAKHESNH